jgi:predicted ATPase
MIAQFGRFLLDSRRRELLADGVAVPLSALDVLGVPIEARGQSVATDELLSRVWSGAAVDANAVPGQISTFREALGKDGDGIKTISGPSDRLMAAMTSLVGSAPAPADPGSASVSQRYDAPPPANLQKPPSDLIGREAQLSTVADLVVTYRLVTLVGAGGIGKSRLSVELGRRLLSKFADGVWLVELGLLSDPELVLSAVATALGVAGDPDSPERLAAALASKHLLLVLDNCEHVIDAAARIAKAFLRAGTSLQLIATSRAPLRVAGERVYRVPALDVPAAGTDDTGDVLRHSAVQLFVAHARAAEPGFALDAQSGGAVAKICRRLDGIPLAIELAAARAATLGVEALAAQLDDRFGLLTLGRPTAPARHRTLRAALDWSYALLPEPERVIMRRLAVFAGGFTLQAAGAIAGESGDTADEVGDQVLELAAKSLLYTDASGAEPHYRLLETTRAYALEKLAASGEFETVARRHAEFVRGLFERPEPEQATRSMPEWLAAYGRAVHEVRAALDWAFSPDGDAKLGVALTATSEPIWFALSLMDECCRRVECALSSLRAGAGGGAHLEMRLSAALAAAVFYTKGPGPEVYAAWTDVLAIAERLDVAEYRSRALWGLHSHHMGNGECRAALTLAHRFVSLPPDQVGPTDRLVGERLLGTSLHFLGDQSDARRHFEHVLSHYPASMAESPADIIRFEWSRRSAARGTLARVLLLQGFPDQAMGMAQTYVEEARATDHPISVCWALDAMCAVALAVGDLATAEHSVAMLLEHSARHGLGFLQALGRGFAGELLIKRGDVAGGVQCLRVALDELGKSRFVLRRPALLGVLAEALAAAGQVAEGVLTIDAALTQFERTDERWNMAEVLRIKGELLLPEGTPRATAAAEDHLLQALGWARRQGALFWELRCATSLARLRKQQGRFGEAHALLSAVHDRFTEGFDTADLTAAKALLDSLPALPAHAHVMDVSCPP